MSSLRILIVDDHEAVRQGVRALLSACDDWTVCGEAKDGVEAVAKARNLRPDVVLMDISMPRMNGLDATRIIRQDLPDSQIVIVSQNDPAIARRQAEDVQAAAYVAKSDLSHRLLPTISKFLNGVSPKKASAEPSPASTAHWLAGGGIMGRLIREHDWSQTPLGAPETWSPALQMMVRFMLPNPFPQLLWWGPQLCCLYNDAYAPVLGAKHPWALGRPTAEVWREVWHVIGPLVEAPFRGGPATWVEDIPLEVNRSGFLEETHFTIAYSPVPDETVPSLIGGVLATVHEISQKVVGDRRVTVLKDLGARSAEPKSAEEACMIAAQALERHSKDIPFALFYLIDKKLTHAHFVAGAGVNSEDRTFPRTVAFEKESGPDWPFANAMKTKEIQLVEDLTTKFETVPQGPWAEAPKLAALVPIRSNAAHQLAGFAVLGISSRLQFDDSYRSFLDLVSSQISISIANARAYEEERKRSEALAEIDRAKTAFFSNVSHEFRTPLTLMLGPVEDLLAKSHIGLSPAAKSQLELVNRNGSRLLRLVNTLLDFSRIEAGRMQAIYQATDLAAFTVELASVFRSATEKAGLRLDLDCPKLKEPVFVDRGMWEKIVLNLISNAFKFTFEGGITVALSEVDDHVELRIRDTGVGIPRHELPRLFDRFHRIENTRSRTHEGSGIGLALVQELVKLHGGSVRVESAVGKGTTFIVSLPLGSAHLPAERIGGTRTLASTAVGAAPFVEEALRWLPDTGYDAETEILPSDELIPIPCPSLASSGAGTEKLPLILVADDNTDMRQYLVRLLGERYEVKAVPDGKAALAVIPERSPDLVLTDVMMPNLDGFGLLHELRSAPETRTIPIILLSARAGEESRVEGMEHGADDYLIKPFSARELLARVQTHLEMARMRKQAAEALRQRTQQFETLLNEAPLGVYMVDSDFRIRELNPTARAAFAELPEPVGADFAEVIRNRWPKEYADEVLSHFRHTLETGEPYVAPEWIRDRRDIADRQFYEWQTARIPLPDGNYGVVCYFRDISRQVQAREAIAQSEERLRALADDLERQVRSRTQELEERNAEVLQQSDQLRELSNRLLQTQDEERRRIARELHDSAGQILTALGLNLSMVMEHAAADPQLGAATQESDRLVRQLSQEIRTMSYLLHPPLLDETGLSGALQWYTHGLTERSGLNIALDIAEDFGRLPAEMELAVFRIVQECLTNIHRHSGSQTASIRLVHAEKSVLIDVEDQGKGIPAEKLAGIQGQRSGVGITGMRERVRHLKGVMEIRSHKGGTKISVKLPANFTPSELDAVLEEVRTAK